MAAQPESQENLVKMGYLPPGASQAQYEYARDMQLKDANHAIENAAQGLNPDGRAIDPGYQKASGLLNENLQSKFNPDMQGMEAYRARALGTGPSAWAQQALGKQGLEEQGLKNSAQAQGASAQSQARSSLASKYGLSPAAQQRLALQGQRDQMGSLQNVGFQGAKTRADIGVQDEATKNQFLQNLPGQELNLANANTANQQFNIGQAVNQNNAQNLFNINKYNENMKAWAAGKTADAQGNSGGGGKK